MEYSIEKSLEILERTPEVLESLLLGLSDEWANGNEGAATWSPFDIVGHLIHGEKTDWIPRMELILSDSADKTFQPFDRFAQQQASEGKALTELLQEFKMLRSGNVERLRSQGLTSGDLLKRGMHPALGEVTLQQLLSTWTVHDLNHIAQAARVMARQYENEVGPWKEYLGVLNSSRNG